MILKLFKAVFLNFDYIYSYMYKHLSTVILFKKNTQTEKFNRVCAPAFI